MYTDGSLPITLIGNTIRDHHIDAEADEDGENTGVGVYGDLTDEALAEILGANVFLRNERQDALCSSSEDDDGSGSGSSAHGL